MKTLLESSSSVVGKEDISARRVFVQIGSLFV
jgi:hypothetical protein